MAAKSTKIGVLGSGDVGRHLAQALSKAGYSVKVSTRDPSKLNDKLKAWVEKGDGKSVGVATCADTAKFADVVLVCTGWAGTEEALKLCGEDNIRGKVLMDVTNPIANVNGSFELSVSGNTSAGELVQGWAKNSKVVKCFNCVGTAQMVNPDFKGQKPDMFICGNDDGAKKVITEIIGNLGWAKEHVVDTGKIDSSRYLEALCVLWCRYMAQNNWSTNHAFALLRTNVNVKPIVSPEDAADRLAIRELVEAYAHCADRRDASGQMALFTPDTHFIVFYDAKSPQPGMDLHRREDLAPVFADLKKYEATTHLLGQSTIALNGDRATGETYCVAHHVTAKDGKRTLFVASLRYYDVFAKGADGKWLFAERKLIVDWMDTRPMTP